MTQDWNTSKQKNTGLRKDKERAIVIGLITKGMEERTMSDYLDELEFLALTAGADVIKRFTQKLTNPKSKLFLGEGKVEEIGEYIEEHNIEIAIFDDDLTPKQANNLEKAWEIKIVDRSMLILDIFADRAQTAQAKSQVELAQMQYLLPRLRGLWTHLERQKGGIGMRGPGEQEIETDRRIIRDKISKLKKKLEKIDLQNSVQRKNRGNMIRVALVGYTNAGKSTLMNLLSKSEVFAEDKLFATLDTTVRKLVWDRMPFLMSDTVGFIRKLPHHLVESFKSTLDELRESDLLIHVVDFSHPNYEDHINTVEQTLHDLGVAEKDCILVFNKLDLFQKNEFDAYLDEETKKYILEGIKTKFEEKHQQKLVFISAKERVQIDALRNQMKSMIEKLYETRYPYIAKYW
jgi:GTP-binding protein HflX